MISSAEKLGTLRAYLVCLQKKRVRVNISRDKSRVKKEYNNELEV